jgi:hypothetical protein
MSHKFFITIDYDELYYIVDILNNLENTVNASIIKPLIKEINISLPVGHTEETIQIERTLIKKIYLTFNQLANKINNISIDKGLTILKNSLLSYKPERKDLFNIALSMTFYEAGMFDRERGFDIIDYPIFVSEEEISDWMAGWQS